MSIEQYIESHLGCKISDKKTISSGETSSFKILTNTGLSIFAKYQDIENNNLINQARELALLKESMNAPNRPTFGSTPAIPEKAIASGIIAKATTRPDRRSC